MKQLKKHSSKAYYTVTSTLTISSDISLFTDIKKFKNDDLLVARKLALVYALRLLLNHQNEGNMNSYVLEDGNIQLPSKRLSISVDFLTSKNDRCEIFNSEEVDTSCGLNTEFSYFLDNLIIDVDLLFIPTTSKLNITIYPSINRLLDLLWI